MDLSMTLNWTSKFYKNSLGHDLNITKQDLKIGTGYFKNSSRLAYKHEGMQKLFIPESG